MTKIRFDDPGNRRTMGIGQLVGGLVVPGTVRLRPNTLVTPLPELAVAPPPPPPDPDPVFQTFNDFTYYLAPAIVNGNFAALEAVPPTINPQDYALLEPDVSRITFTTAPIPAWDGRVGTQVPYLAINAGVPKNSGKRYFELAISNVDLSPGSVTGLSSYSNIDARGLDIVGLGFQALTFSNPGAFPDLPDYPGVSLNSRGPIISVGYFSDHAPVLQAVVLSPVNAGGYQRELAASPATVNVGVAIDFDTPGGAIWFRINGDWSPALTLPQPAWADAPNGNDVPVNADPATGLNPWAVGADVGINLFDTGAYFCPQVSWQGQGFTLDAYLTSDAMQYPVPAGFIGWNDDSPTFPVGAMNMTADTESLTADNSQLTADATYYL